MVYYYVKFYASIYLEKTFFGILAVFRISDATFEALNAFQNCVLLRQCSCLFMFTWCSFLHYSDDIFGLFIMTFVMWDSPDYCVNCLNTNIKFSGQVSPHFWLIYLLLIFDIAIQFLNAALCDLWWSTVSYTKVLLILKATDQKLWALY